MADKSTRAGLEVIGAGFGRTGTVSLKKALEILGYDPTYHMMDVMSTPGHVNFWIRIAKGEKVDFNEVYGKRNYLASCDTPCSSFWKEQLEQYPDAKVVLTVRDSEKWFKSWDQTIYQIISDAPHSNFVSNFALLLLNMRQFHMSVIKCRIFNNDYSKENTIKCFNEHNAAVIAECPKDKLLVFEVTQGWEPLCKFLGKPIPDVPFPHLNDSNEFKKATIVINIVGAVSIVLIALPLIGAVYYCGKGCTSSKVCCGVTKK